MPKFCSSLASQVCFCFNCQHQLPVCTFRGLDTDTLLLGAREKLALPEGESYPKVEFLKRVITRDPARCTDLEIPVSLDDFNEAEKRGDFALSWRAHGTS